MSAGALVGEKFESTLSLTRHITLKVEEKFIKIDDTKMLRQRQGTYQDHNQDSKSQSSDSSSRLDQRQIGEVISLHIGQAGCELGAPCWELCCYEHGIELNGKCKADSSVPKSFFNELGSTKAVPRAAFIDLEPTAIDNIRLGNLRELFNTSNMLNGKEDAANCFGTGFLTLGNEMIGSVRDRIRIMMEACGSLQGFLIFRAQGGGTGSGFTARLLEELSYDHPKTDKFDFSIFSSPRMSSLPVEPYNSAFAMHHSLEYSCASFLFDNQACYDICDRLLDVCEVRFSDINNLLAQVISSITAPFRYDGSVSINMNELRTNLIPFPRLQYPMVSSAPLLSKYQRLSEDITESSIINACFANSNQLVSCDVKKGTYMTCILLLRGNVNNACVNTALQTVMAKKDVRFVEWTPKRFKVAVNNEPTVNLPAGNILKANKTCVLLSNCTQIKKVFQSVSRKFYILYSKKAFVHWYISEGLEEGDFQDTRLDLMSLISDYSETEIGI